MSAMNEATLPKNISVQEQSRFARFSPLERQCMYARGTCLKKYVTESRLRETLKWKFGKCMLTKQQRIELIKYFEDTDES